jgi:hypothetical protein
VNLLDTNSPVGGGDGETLFILVQQIESLAERLVKKQRTELANPTELDGAWSIARARFELLKRTVRSSKVLDDLEDELIALGLVGPEMRFREEVLSELIAESTLESESCHAALRLGVSLLRSLSNLPHLSATIDATIGFCESLLANEGLANRNATNHY